MWRFFSGTKLSPSQHRLTQTNSGLAVPRQDLPSCPRRAGTSFVLGRLGGDRLAFSLPCQICRVSPQSSARALKNREKNTKSQVLLPPIPVLPMLLPASALLGEQRTSQPQRGTCAGTGCFHGCFRVRAAVPCRGGAAFPCESLFFKLGCVHCWGTCKVSCLTSPQLRYLMGVRMPGAKTPAAQALEELRAVLGASSVHIPSPTVSPSFCTLLKQPGLPEL